MLLFRTYSFPTVDWLIDWSKTFDLHSSINQSINRPINRILMLQYWWRDSLCFSHFLRRYFWIECNVGVEVPAWTKHWLDYMSSPSKKMLSFHKYSVPMVDWLIDPKSSIHLSINQSINRILMLQYWWRDSLCFVSHFLRRYFWMECNVGVEVPAWTKDWLDFKLECNWTIDGRGNFIHSTTLILNDGTNFAEKKSEKESREQRPPSAIGKSTEINIEGEQKKSREYEWAKRCKWYMTRSWINKKRSKNRDNLFTQCFPPLLLVPQRDSPVEKKTPVKKISQFQFSNCIPVWRLLLTRPDLPGAVWRDSACAVHRSPRHSSPNFRPESAGKCAGPSPETRPPRGRPSWPRSPETSGRCRRQTASPPRTLHHVVSPDHPKRTETSNFFNHH